MARIEHTLNGKQLLVKKRHPFIYSQTINNSSRDSVTRSGITTENETEETQGTCDDVICDRTMTSVDVDEDVMQFIMGGAHAKKLHCKLDQLKAVIEWNPGNRKATVTKKVGSGYIRKWAKSCQDVVYKFLDQFEKFSVSLDKGVVTAVGESLSRLEQNLSKEKALCYCDEDKQNVVVVCVECDREDVSQSVKKFLEILRNEEIRKTYQKETIKDIRQEHMLFLLQIGFIKEIEGKYPQLKLTMDYEQQNLCFEGPPEQIMSSRNEYYRLMAAVTEQSLNVEHIITSEPGLNYVREKLSWMNITAMILKENENAVKIIAKSQSDCEKANQCLLESIVKEDVPLDVKNSFIFKTEKFKNITKKIIKSQLVNIFIENSKVLVLNGITEAVSDARKEIKDFIEREQLAAQETDNYPVSKEVARFLREHCSEKLKKLEETLSPSHVSIHVDQSAVHVKGTQRGIEKCRELFLQLFDTIVVENIKFSSPGLSKLILGENWKSNLKLIEMERKVIIKTAKETKSGAASTSADAQINNFSSNERLTTSLSYRDLGATQVHFSTF